jgi:predicted Rossmann fold flavoprotein
MASKQIIVVGGGAAGFFAAMACAESNPGYRVIILEKSPKLLEKVKISGGGRCNVTHACFNPKDLVKFYPRGEKQLLGPFNRFFTGDTVSWFENRGVELKEEEDGRMFPVSDSSQTIIDCYLHEAKRLGVDIRTLIGVDDLIPPTDGNTKWQVKTNRDTNLLADAVIITTGSAARMWQILQKLGHTVIEPVPSLFTFNIKDERIADIPGVSVPHAQVNVVGSKLNASGPLLITHWGMSGPAILRLSAWGARDLANVHHKFQITVNYTGTLSLNEATAQIKTYKQLHPKRQATTHPLFDLPQRLWKNLVHAVPGLTEINWADTTNKQIDLLAKEIAAGTYNVTGKSTYKDEFVTAGGLCLDEVDFKTMQSKKHAGLYFAGEVLDIDAITGGFNFQAAWTTGWIAGNAV